MEQAAAVQAQGGGLFGQLMTPKIEERAFDFQARGGQDYKFFLVVRSTCVATYVAVRYASLNTHDPRLRVVPCECVSKPMVSIRRRHPNDWPLVKGAFATIRLSRCRVLLYLDRTPPGTGTA